MFWLCCRCTKCTVEKTDCDKPVFDKVQSLDPLNESDNSSNLSGKLLALIKISDLFICNS